MTVSQYADMTVKSIIETMNELAPCRKKLRLLQWKDKLWINAEVRKLCEDRDILYKRAISAKN